MRPQTLRHIARALEPLSAALGTAQFEAHLAELLGSLLPHDMMSVARYSRHAVPELVAHSANFPRSMAATYADLYRRFDPYARRWRDNEKLTVVTLSEMTSPRQKVDRYVREFLFENGIRDEIGIFLPAIAGASLGIFHESATRRYGKSEKRLLQEIHPFLANLYRTHLAAVFAVPHDAPAGLPTGGDAVVVTTETGEMVWSTKAWTDLSSDDRAAIGALIAGNAHPDGRDLALDDGRILTGDRLGHQGSRIVWTLAAEPQPNLLPAAPDVDAWAFDQDLTPRERDVVKHILAGYPTSLIAERLGLSRGTVKNHRRRIYQKLDITTERELFLMYIETALGKAT